MLPNWTVPNNYKLAEIEENVTFNITLPIENLEDVTTKVISGSLPLGLRLENNKILGTPFEVDRPTTSTFVIRATADEGIADRTFYILVSGKDDPRWVTPEGRLPIGPNGVYFILDNSLIDFQLLADDPDLPSGTELEYRLTGGELPPGITLTKSGKLTGIVDPILAFDINVVDGNYDKNPLDILPYDFGFGLDPNSRIPRKLNREYYFRITVSDNVSSITRQFQIFVVGDDFARADNTIMKAADGVFTADFTFLRVPLWLTPSNLGVRRANNFLTIFLDAYDSNTVPGELQYFFEPVNDDGTASVLPPGLTLDSKTGDLAGRVPYQPAVTRDYKFTIKALRFNTEIGLFTVFGTYLEDTLARKTATFKIGKVQRTVFNGLTELQNLVGKDLVIENKTYRVISVNETNPSFDTITVDRPLESIDEFSSLSISRSIGSAQDYFFVDSMPQSDKNFYFKKVLRYSNSEFYLIDDVYPYIEWEITSGNQPIRLIGDSDSSLLEDSLKNIFDFDIRESYIEVTRNEFEEAIGIKILIPSTAQNRNKAFIESLFETENSTPVTVTKITEEDRVKLNKNIEGALSNDLNFGIPIDLAIVRGGSFNSTFSRSEEEVASKKKTFTIRLIGEVDSTIIWLTPINLGTLAANRISTLSVKAQSSVEDAVVKYSIISGSLPPGLTLSQDGEIIGKVPVTGSEEAPGLIRFIDDGNLTTFDFGNTTFDREFRFTVLAKDRFEYSAIEREFLLIMSDEDNLNYSNIYFKPYLKSTQRQQFRSLVDNAQIFVPSMIYRPNDPNFGIQKDLKCLVYGGIENLNLENYVAAIAKNHKRKRFYLGEIKTAVAKNPGTNNVVYEVVYVELVDPNSSPTGTSAKIRVSNENRITVDSVSYETKDDSTVSPTGVYGLEISLNDDETPQNYILYNMTVTTNSNGEVELADENSITVFLNDNTFVTVNGEALESLIDNNLLPIRYRPKGNTIKTDSSGITADQNSSNFKYISNIDNMRQNIKNINIDNQRVATNRDFLPLWMRTPQGTSLSEIDYTLAIPIAYTKPGFSQTVKENIENSRFDFKTIDFDIDRYIIDNTKDINREQYIVFANYQFNV
jgi:hypothetical protein